MPLPIRLGARGRALIPIHSPPSSWHRTFDLNIAARVCRRQDRLHILFSYLSFSRHRLTLQIVSYLKHIRQRTCDYRLTPLLKFTLRLGRAFSNLRECGLGFIFLYPYNIGLTSRLTV